MGTRDPAYPKLPRSPEYLIFQLTLFANDRRGGSPYGHIMREVATQLTADQMTDVVAYSRRCPLVMRPTGKTDRIESGPHVRSVSSITRT
ncbi:MAG: hypothetical protein HOP16_09725 [Acidobacteria bacterium]|nr:hypothetical protein [Acidobacteriota bacterium]